MGIEQALLSFAVVAALLTIIPGLDTVLVLRSSISQGRLHGYATALGINAGAMTWGIAAAVGASALLAASETAFTVLKLAGALYLAWLGAGMPPPRPFPVQQDVAPSSTTSGSYVGESALGRCRNKYRDPDRRGAVQ